jgi:tetratricopeptide (TPR) repeat protein
MSTTIKSAILYLLLAVCLVFTNSCKKFLEEKSDKKLLIPSTLPQLQSLLDNYSTMNSNYCGAGVASADNYYWTDDGYNAMDYDYDKRMYIWGKDNLFALGTDGNDWSYCYNAVYAANSVIDLLSKISRTSSHQAIWDDIKGQALFFRGSRYLDAAFIWTLAYDALSAPTDLGLPLRLGTDFNEPSVRSTLQQTFMQVIADVKAAISLLPVTSVTIYRPSKPAAYGLLARAYLSMNDYENAGLYADSCLRLYNQLIDYNSLSPSSSHPVIKLNVETMFYSGIATSYPLTYASVPVDSSLYNSYDSNDLRKTVFFRSKGDGTYSFKGSYTGGSVLFSGIATDEIYLIRAECLARKGNTQSALDNLNALLINRWKAGTFVPVEAISAAEALNIILQERRKELLMRGLRWPDVKRLNKTGAGISLYRIINGEKYTLAPGDPRFALPIPEDVIEQSSIQQNPR